MTVEIKIYEKNQPRIEAIKVTRTNYHDIAEKLEMRVTVQQNEFDLVQTVSLIPKKGDSLVFKIPINPSTPYEAYISREITQKDATWEVIRQYDLSFGYSEVETPKNTKENN